MGPINHWDRRFLVLVKDVTSWSKDPSTKHAAVIVRPDRSIVSYGYNNFPAGIKDTPERLNDRPTKYELVVHAETNALLFAREDVKGYTLYCDTVPCCRCAVNIIAAGIVKVVCFAPTADYCSRWADSTNKALDRFAEGTVIINMVEDF